MWRKGRLQEVHENALHASGHEFLLYHIRRHQFEPPALIKHTTILIRNMTKYGYLLPSWRVCRNSSTKPASEYHPYDPACFVATRHRRDKHDKTIRKEKRKGRRKGRAVVPSSSPSAAPSSSPASSLSSAPSSSPFSSALHSFFSCCSLFLFFGSFLGPEKSSEQLS